MNVATLQPPAGAGNVDVVFVPGDTVKVTEDGPLIIAIPDPPEPPSLLLSEPPPPPPPVLTVPGVPGEFVVDGPPPPIPPVAPVPAPPSPPAPPPA